LRDVALGAGGRDDELTVANGDGSGGPTINSRKSVHGVCKRLFHSIIDLDKCLILLAPRAGFEPATIRLTVESGRFSKSLMPTCFSMWAPKASEFMGISAEIR
jgi:hypothetical protein